ncbi:hypothetical protein EBA29_02884 [Bacillus velezensis]|uniref:Uncharacterized protein n=1 Tax=Bacillus amyloliquefaciens (strain Y2) TaxID=1155777 RepID=I2C957_BACAY|nr:hypothetical protein MUS_3297 [Bacillus velezensis YAU B9601-Y2]AMQ75191.1 hypothetical protein BAMY6614_18065 [Bacillus amyloliquefaciens UMAF6614]QAR57906.1 hypothetical protein EBA29_02884 [Bacillus velezensis]RUS08104.1 hypothetical protein EFW58_00852 [Bacillus velezensis]
MGKPFKKQNTFKDSLSFAIIAESGHFRLLYVKKKVVDEI